jgi:hypothetical protein
MNKTTDSTRRPTLLYLSINDGSDTRINKEIITLSSTFLIDFVGVAAGEPNPFIEPYVRQMEVVKGRRRSIWTLLRLFMRVMRLLAIRRYDSVHVINENLYLVLWPLLIGQHVVLDVFDSVFLKVSMPEWLARLGARFCYALPARIIVTDEERAELMPVYTRFKLVILPNYPFRYFGAFNNREPGLVRILYTGSLERRRGTTFLQTLLAVGDDVRIVMAGWICEGDEQTLALSRDPRVEWLGVQPQVKIIEQATRCDFILCHYDPSITNNIYASPNKIYDAIQARVGVIINSEVRISSFVREHNLGVVLDAFEPTDMASVIESLRQFKSTFQPDPALPAKYVWESVQKQLLESHKLTAG